ncbi:hypothetical protein [Corynebacterium sp.]|uniref:hypothetical protein n=1 Tax=Corynebacterium sp. TaxID=1720 RepID=UPI003B3A437E
MVSLLDVEFAVLGPVEVDLCRLVREAQVTEDGELTESEAGSTAAEIAGRLPRTAGQPVVMSCEPPLGS